MLSRGNSEYFITIVMAYFTQAIFTRFIRISISIPQKCLLVAQSKIRENRRHGRTEP